MNPPGGPRRPGSWRRGPRWAWLLVICGAVLVVVSGGGYVTFNTVLNHLASKFTQAGGLGNAGTTGTSIAGPINLLLVGIDERANDPASGARSDSIIISHIPASHDSAYLVSVPRDSLVDIPPFKATNYAGGKDKINAAFFHGFINNGGRGKGLELLADTVSNLSGGLKFNGAVIINFAGLQKLIEAVGGIRMCVDEKVTSIHIGWNRITGKEGVPYVLNPSDFSVLYLKQNYQPQVYYPGCRAFNGWQALDYARQRDILGNGDGDYGRQRHQQQLIRAVLTKATSSGVVTNPLKVNNVLNSLGGAVTFYNNNVSIADWIFTLKGIRPSAMTMVKTNAGTYNPQTVNGSVSEVLSPTSLQLLKSITNDDVGSFVAANPSWVTPAGRTPSG